MALDQESQWVLDLVAEANRPKLNTLSPPEARAAWHVRNNRFHPSVNGGKRRVNHWSLAIEIVSGRPSDSTQSFSEWQVATTARIVRSRSWRFCSP